jgi:hypothetical protein
MGGEFKKGGEDVATGNEGAAGWRPIETAPRDGTRVLLWPVNSLIRIGQYKQDTPRLKRPGWYFHGTSGSLRCDPTIWMPIPPLPKESGE